jgi:DNA-binding YbaB/EbfC family protein
MTDKPQLDFTALAQRARQMQADMADVQEQMSRLEATGHSGGGLVTATVGGEGRILALDIDRSVIDPEDPRTLSDLVIAAVDSANQAMSEMRAERMSAVGEGISGMLDGLHTKKVGGGTVVPRFAPRDRMERMDRMRPPGQ